MGLEYMSMRRLWPPLLAVLLAACASVPRSTATDAGAGGRPPSPDAGAALVQPEGAARERDAEYRLQQVMQMAQPRAGQLARARSQLEAFLALDDEASRKLHPYARALLDQVMERQRLDTANSKLTQQLERSAQQLKDSQARAEELQRKLDALADIERSLPGSRPAVRGVPR